MNELNLLKAFLKSGQDDLKRFSVDGKGKSPLSGYETEYQQAQDLIETVKLRLQKEYGREC